MAKAESKQPSKIVFHPDGYKIYGPKTDGGGTLTLSIGEYEQPLLAQLLFIPQETRLKVIVEVDNDGDKD